MLIRPARPGDAEALCEIYNPVVQTSTATFDLVPRSVEEQRRWITDRSGAHIVLVAELDRDAAPDDAAATDAAGTDAAGTGDGAVATSDAEQAGTVVGYAALSPYRDRAAYATTVENSVYVHPDHQGRGVGRDLLAALVDTARAHGFHAVMARIVADHEASIALHSTCGFQVVGHEREVGRKFGRWLDVTLMERLL